MAEEQAPVAQERRPKRRVEPAKEGKGVEHFAQIKNRLLNIIEDAGLRRKSRQNRPLRMVHPCVIFEALDMVHEIERLMGRKLPTVNIPKEDLADLELGLDDEAEDVLGATKEDEDERP